MISPETGTITYSPALIISPAIDPHQIPESAIRRVQAWTDQSGHSWNAIHLHPVSQNAELHLTLRFCEDRLFSAEFFANIQPDELSWSHWSLEKEQRRKHYHDGLLLQWLGQRTEFDWGHCWSLYDTKGGFSTFGVTFSSGNARPPR